MFGYLVCGCQAILSPAADIAKILGLVYRPYPISLAFRGWLETDAKKLIVTTYSSFGSSLHFKLRHGAGGRCAIRNSPFLSRQPVLCCPVLSPFYRRLASNPFRSLLLAFIIIHGNRVVRCCTSRLITLQFVST
jgi:hypothetical protein